MYRVVLDEKHMTHVDLDADSHIEDTQSLKLFRDGKVIAVFRSYVGAYQFAKGS